MNKRKQLKVFKPDGITPLKPELKHASPSIRDQYVLVKLKITKDGKKDQTYSVEKHSVEGVTRKWQRDGWKVEFLN